MKDAQVQAILQSRFTEATQTLMAFEFWAAYYGVTVDQIMHDQKFAKLREAIEGKQ